MRADFVQFSINENAKKEAKEKFKHYNVFAKYTILVDSKIASIIFAAFETDVHRDAYNVNLVNIYKNRLKPLYEILEENIHIDEYVVNYVHRRTTCLDMHG